MRILRRFINDEAGATAIEYALIEALMATFIIAGINLIGGGLTAAFTTIQGCLSGGAC